MASEVTPVSFGDRIAELRRQRRWTQHTFAEKIGVHTNHITRWESNRYKPSGAMLQKIAEVFEIRVDDLLDPASLVPESMSHDKELVTRIEQLKELDPQQRAIIYDIINTYAKQKRMEKLLLDEKAVAKLS
jgi:transcriptional regulator with XRE-family HTH domain